MLGQRRFSGSHPQLISWLLCAKYRRFPTAAELVAIIMAIREPYSSQRMVRIRELAITPLGLFWGLFRRDLSVLYIYRSRRLLKNGSLIIGLGLLIGGLIFPIVSPSLEV